jgi:hypothetical protein
MRQNAAISCSTAVHGEPSSAALARSMVDQVEFGKSSRTRLPAARMRIIGDRGPDLGVLGIPGGDPCCARSSMKLR